MKVREFNSANELLAHYKSVRARQFARDYLPQPKEQPAVEVEETVEEVTVKPWEPVVWNTDAPAIEHPINRIVRIVAESRGFSRHEIMSRRKNGNLPLTRWIAMYFARKTTRVSHTQIGRRMGGRDHSTVMHGIAELEKLMTANPILAAEMDALRKLITPEEAGL